MVYHKPFLYLWLPFQPMYVCHSIKSKQCFCSAQIKINPIQSVCLYSFTATLIISLYVKFCFMRIVKFYQSFLEIIREYSEFLQFGVIIFSGLIEV